MPTLIVAIGVFYTWSLGWAIGPIRFGSHLTGSALGLILAHTALAIPMVVVLSTASLRTLDRTFELAAAGLGANPWNRFWTITFPLMLPGIAAAAVFAFLTSWDEALVSLFLTNATFQTFPVRMFLQVREAVDPSVAAAATILIALTTALFTLALLSRARGSAQ
jgi:putative spermidine/putrescine transport system permease protein